MIGGHLQNIHGYTTNRKIVVLESDDWGSIRMPSKEVFETLIKRGIRVDRLSFNRYDSLASEEDLSALFEVLAAVKDKNGNPAIFTANTVVANPNFEKIKESNFQNYYYELFTETLARYPQHRESFKLWHEGMKSRVFHPQFHGREHLNTVRWLYALRNNIGNVRLAFDNRMFDLSRSGDIISEDSFMDALAFNDYSEIKIIQDSIREGLGIFENLFGYKSKSFIASCYIWDPKIEKTLADEGVSYIQGGRFQRIPIPGSMNQYIRKFHFTGQRNDNGQIYLVRNCFFEPSETASNGLLEECIRRIQASFFWKKPAIISTHRMNYIGFINRQNRIKNLALLKELLQRIKKVFPDVEFLTSDQLGTLIQAEEYKY